MIPPGSYSLGQIWHNKNYYQTDDGQQMPKFEALLARGPGPGDLLTACFTSKPNGLPESPACFLGPPRAGYCVGLLGPPMTKMSWVDFNSVKYRDQYYTDKWFRAGVLTLTGLSLTPAVLRNVLECLSGSDDLRTGHWKWIQATLHDLPST